jgi:hypothetical protein
MVEIPNRGKGKKGGKACVLLQQQSWVGLFHMDFSRIFYMFLPSGFPQWCMCAMSTCSEVESEIYRLISLHESLIWEFKDVFLWTASAQGAAQLKREGKDSWF